MPDAGNAAARSVRFAAAAPIGGEEGSRPPARSRAATVGAAYILCALASALVNVGVQEAVRQLGTGDAILGPMLAGTLAGFAAKYGLDKVFVFADAYRGPTSELRKIALYSAFSVGTTLVFWGAELAFWGLWHTPQARYAGAMLGLALGYAAKYHLDRAFVFRDRPA